MAATLISVLGRADVPAALLSQSDEAGLHAFGATVRTRLSAGDRQAAAALLGSGAGRVPRWRRLFEGQGALARKDARPVEVVLVTTRQAPPHRSDTSELGRAIVEAFELSPVPEVAEIRTIDLRAEPVRMAGLFERLRAPLLSELRSAASRGHTLHVQHGGGTPQLALSVLLLAIAASAALARPVEIHEAVEQTGGGTKLLRGAIARDTSGWLRRDPGLLAVLEDLVTRRQADDLRVVLGQLSDLPAETMRLVDRAATYHRRDEGVLTHDEAVGVLVHEARAALAGDDLRAAVEALGLLKEVDARALVPGARGPLLQLQSTSGLKEARNALHHGAGARQAIHRLLSTSRPRLEAALHALSGQYTEDRVGVDLAGALDALRVAPTTQVLPEGSSLVIALGEAAGDVIDGLALSLAETAVADVHLELIATSHGPRATVPKATETADRLHEALGSCGVSLSSVRTHTFERPLNDDALGAWLQDTADAVARRTTFVADTVGPKALRTPFILHSLARGCDVHVIENFSAGRLAAPLLLNGLVDSLRPWQRDVALRRVAEVLRRPDLIAPSRRSAKALRALAQDGDVVVVEDIPATLTTRLERLRRLGDLGTAEVLLISAQARLASGSYDGERLAYGYLTRAIGYIERHLLDAVARAAFSRLDAAALASWRRADGARTCTRKWEVETSRARLTLAEADAVARCLRWEHGCAGCPIRDILTRQAALPAELDPAVTECVKALKHRRGAVAHALVLQPAVPRDADLLEILRRLGHTPEATDIVADLVWAVGRSDP